MYFDGKKRFLTFLKFDNQRPIKKQSQKFSLTNSKLEKKQLKLCLKKTNANAKKSLEF
ncbi:hypothetical protein [Helicobacter pylori]|uniref:Integrase n=1 Tax=Helicobacter pylori UM037 TaxID=1321939 RepID=A0AB33Z805_HELPX|nr:hypothetical protein [Helicobacter pylori]EQK94890.1 hypothetical protein N198_05930 [Helicobacter pylori UM037]